MKTYEASHGTSGTATGPETLSFQGGVDGIGVTSGTPRIYLVFWGSQWGTQGTDSNGNLTFSNDGSGGAPYIQQLFKGLGTGNELWSGTMTQYCDGSSVAVGATSCPSGAPHIGYPTGGALAGVWYDGSSAEPAIATGHQIGQEAVNAAAHFGNTTAASNRYVQYDILSAPGLDPDDYQSNGFCAWHDYNGDSSLSGGGVSSPYGDIAFTNMPYVMDAGAGCGQGFVNSPGTLDGYSIVNGHEYAETITDQNPAGGWLNATGSTFNGQENGDECAWISSGQGASADVTTGSGTFAMQSTWSNDTNECDIAHAIVGGPPPSVTLSPFAGSFQAGVWQSGQVTQSSSASQSVSLSTTSSGGHFSTSASPTGPCSGPAGVSVTVPSGSTGAGFSYCDTIAGTPTLRGAATGFTSGSQTATVTPGSLAQVTVSPSPVTLPAGHSQWFSATPSDAYGNQLSGQSFTWSVTPASRLGSLSGQSATSISFTAAKVSSDASGSITATDGSTSGTATIMVTPSVPTQRLSGADAIATSLAVSAAGWPTAGSASAVVLARSDYFSDALAGGPLAAYENGPLLITPGASKSQTLDPRVLGEIQRVLPAGGTVYILGGKYALSPNIDKQLAAAGFNVVRVFGNTEYDTAVAIANQMGNPTTIFEATGTSFADALSAVPAAIQAQGAILLTDGDHQAPATATYLNTHTVLTRYAIGGRFAASGADPSATSVSGLTLYDTSAAVANTFFPSASYFGAATGSNFPDALAGGVFMGSASHVRPVLLVRLHAPLPTGIGDYVANDLNLTNGYIFGGLLVIAADTAQNL